MNNGGGAANFQVPKSFADQFRSVNQTPPNPYSNINQGNLGGGYKQFEYPPPSSSQMRPQFDAKPSNYGSATLHNSNSQLSYGNIMPQERQSIGSTNRGTFKNVYEMSKQTDQ